MHDNGQGHEAHPSGACEVITLPVRIGWGATRLGLHVAGQALTATLRATERLIEAAVPAGRAPDAAVDRDVSDVDLVVVEPASIDETPPSPPPAPTARRPSTEQVAPPHAAEDVKQTPPGPAPKAGTPTGEPLAPAHVSEEVEFVEAFAEPGAEDGVGAAVHVEEPWKGYRRMAAKEVIARLADAGREELAAVELYEHAHRGRQTVLRAADRRLRGATAAAAAARQRTARRRR